MTTLDQTPQDSRVWLTRPLEKAIRTLAAGGAVALMAAAAHASVGDPAAQAAAPLSSAALQMSIGFLVLALALHRRQRVVEAETVNDSTSV